MTPKRPRDLNQWAAALANGSAVEESPDKGKDVAAVKRGRAGANAYPPLPQLNYTILAA